MPIPAITNFTVVTASAFALSTTTIALSSASNAFSSATAASRFTIRWCDGAHGLH